MDPGYVPGSMSTPADLTCEGRARIRKHLLLGQGKEYHLLLSQHTLCCYPLGNEKTPFSSLDLSSDAWLHVGGKQSFSIRDQTRTTHHFFFVSQAERTKWMAAFQHVGGLQRSLRDYYSIGKTLGRGACGRVNRCTSVLDGQDYAVKEGLAHNPEDYTGRHGLLNELQIMQQLTLSPHEGLPALHDAFRTRDGIVQIVMELMQGRNICAYVASSHQYFEDQARDVFRDITAAVAHLHGLGISHRDIKPENLVFSHMGADARIKVLDFNLAKSVHQPQGWVADTPCGTSPYIAPEVLSHQRYSQSVDMWSLGCTLYLLLSGQIPFRDLNSRLADGRVVRGEWNMDAPEWENVSQEARILVKELLTMDPENRHTAERTLRSRWLTHRPALSDPGEAVQPSKSLATPEAFRRMRNSEHQFPSIVMGASGSNQSVLLSGSPDFGSASPDSPLPAHRPQLSQLPEEEDPDTFHHINAWLDADLQALRLDDERRGTSEDGRDPPEAHNYGSPKRLQQMENLTISLQAAHGAGLQDHHYIDAHGSPR